MNKSLIFGWVVPGLGALAVTVVLLAWQWPFNEPGSIQQPPGNNGLVDEARTTTDVLGIRVVRDGARKLQIMLDIADGWHVNANPASMDFLIPTEITVTEDRALPVRVDYPVGRQIDSSFDKPWMVYDDGTTVQVTVPGTAVDKPLIVEVSAQACHDSGRCLPPNTLREPLAAGTSL